MVNRYAFTMIELIFAIVIIAISVLSLPMMTQITSKNMERGIAQEAIFAASAELNQIISYAWDENSTESGSSLSRVVWDGSSNDCNSTTKRRSGHIDQPYHRRCTDNATLPTAELAFGPESGDLDDLDDINTTAHDIFINYTTSSTGYKKEYTSTFGISYENFDPSFTPNNNIKRISVTIRDKDTNEIITTLNTFSSNIGEIDYYKRSY